MYRAAGNTPKAMQLLRIAHGKQITRMQAHPRASTGKACFPFVFTVCNKLSQCRPTENTSARIQQHQMLAPLGAASLPSMHVHCTPIYTQHAAHSHLMPEWCSQLISQAGCANCALLAGRSPAHTHDNLMWPLTKYRPACCHGLKHTTRFTLPQQLSTQHALPGMSDHCNTQPSSMDVWYNR